MTPVADVEGFGVRAVRLYMEANPDAADVIAFKEALAKLRQALADDTGRP